MGVLFAALTSELVRRPRSRHAWVMLILATIGAPVFKFIVESAEFRVASLSPGELRGREAHALFRSIRLGHWALAAACLIGLVVALMARDPPATPLIDNMFAASLACVCGMLAIDLSFDAQADPRLAWRYYRSNTTSGALSIAVPAVMTAVFATLFAKLWLNSGKKRNWMLLVITVTSAVHFKGVTEAAEFQLSSMDSVAMPGSELHREAARLARTIYEGHCLLGVAAVTSLAVLASQHFKL